MSRTMWKVVEIKAEEVGVAKTERRWRKERRSRKEMRKKKEKTKNKNNNRSKEDSRRIGDMEWKERSSKVRGRSKEASTIEVPQVDLCFW